MEQAKESACVVAPGIERDAHEDVAHYDADQEPGGDAARGEPDVPHLPPPAPFFLAAEFDRDRAEDESRQQSHEDEVKSRENRGVNHRERGKESPSTGDQPNFITVPYRADGVDKDTAVLVFFDEEMQRTDPQVESVEHRVAGEKNTDQDEPNTVQVEAHGAAVPALRRRFSVRAIQLDGISSLSSSWSGPCWIFRVSK